MITYHSVFGGSPDLDGGLHPLNVGALVVVGDLLEEERHSGDWSDEARLLHDSPADNYDVALELKVGLMHVSMPWREA